MRAEAVGRCVGVSGGWPRARDGEDRRSSSRNEDGRDCARVACLSVEVSRRICDHGRTRRGGVALSDVTLCRGCLRWCGARRGNDGGRCSGSSLPSPAVSPPPGSTLSRWATAFLPPRSVGHVRLASLSGRPCAHHAKLFERSVGSQIGHDFGVGTLDETRCPPLTLRQHRVH
jgi:hypothetical protein